MISTFPKMRLHFILADFWFSQLAPGMSWTLILFHTASVMSGGFGSPPLQLENLRYVKNHEGNVKNCLVIIQKCRRFWFSWLCCFFLVFNITRTHIQQPLIYHSVVWFFFLLYFLYCYCFFWYCIIAFSMQSNFLVLQRGSFLKASDNLQWIEINTQDYDNLQKINSMWQTDRATWHCFLDSSQRWIFRTHKQHLIQKYLSLSG